MTESLLSGVPLVVVSLFLLPEVPIDDTIILSVLHGFSVIDNKIRGKLRCIYKQQMGIKVYNHNVAHQWELLPLITQPFNVFQQN